MMAIAVLALGLAGLLAVALPKPQALRIRTDDRSRP